MSYVVIYNVCHISLKCLSSELGVDQASSCVCLHRTVITATYAGAEHQTHALFLVRQSLHQMRIVLFCFVFFQFKILYLLHNKLWKIYLISLHIINLAQLCDFFFFFHLKYNGNHIFLNALYFSERVQQIAVLVTSIFLAPSPWSFL